MTDMQGRATVGGPGAQETDGIAGTAIRAGVTPRGARRQMGVLQAPRPFAIPSTCASAMYRVPGAITAGARKWTR
jgi:hypothetical protein